MVTYITSNIKSDVRAVYAGSVVYLKLAGIVLGGWQMARAALSAERKLQNGGGDTQFYEAKIATATFFAYHFLSQATGYRTAIIEGSTPVLILDEAQF